MATVRHLGLIPDLCIIDKAQSPLFYEQEEISEDGGQNIYREMSLMQMLALYWRVRKFKFTGYFEDNNDYQDGFTEEIVLERQKNNNPLANERELVCFNSGWQSGNVVMNIALADGFETQSEDLNKLAGKIKKDGTQMLPTIYIDWVGAGETGMNVASYAPIGLASQELAGGFTKLDLGYVGSFSWPIYGVEANTANFATMEITVEEWWEYHPNDGLGPIYDKITGKQLRAFPDSYARSSASVS